MVHKYSESTSIPLSTFLSGTRSIAFNFSPGLTSPAVHSAIRCPFPAHLRQTPIFAAHLIHPNLLRRPSLMTRPPPRLTFEVRKVFSLGVSFSRLILPLGLSDWSPFWRGYLFFVFWARPRSAVFFPVSDRAL